MRHLQWFVLVGLVPILASCGSPLPTGTGSGTGSSPASGAGQGSQTRTADGPRELILGRWELVRGDVNHTSEFKEDGTFVRTMNAVQLGGKYRFVEDTAIEIEPNVVDPNTARKKERVQVNVDRNELTLTDTEGKKKTYKRIE